jgi:uncharacterized membrane protein
MELERIHPMLVHFPIALLITSVFLDFLRLVTKKDNFERSAFHLLFLGAISCIPVIIFGHIAADVASDRPHIADTIETHEALGFITAMSFIILLIVRSIFVKKDSYSKIRIYYLTAAVMGIALLLTTAYYGGQLVYDYGAAVSPAILK